MVLCSGLTLYPVVKTPAPSYIDLVLERCSRLLRPVAEIHAAFFMFTHTNSEDPAQQISLLEKAAFAMNAPKEKEHPCS